MMAPISTLIRDIPAEVELGPEDGMRERCAINLDSIDTVRKSYLDRQITTLAADKLREVEEAIHFSLALSY